MDFVERFRARLSSINAATFAHSLPSHENEMAKTTHQLRQWVGGTGSAVKDERGIAVAVAAYLKSGSILSYRDAKYLCFGVTTPQAQTHKKIIEDEKLFSGLLTHVQGYTGHQKKFRRCYQGLFRGYLRYPGHRCNHQVGQRCWGLLRDFLKHYASLVTETKPELDWTTTLGQHLNLLRDDPCAPYGAKLLNGDHSVLDELRERLGIDDDTWVMSELVLSQVSAAIAIHNDEQFKSHIPKLVTLLATHPLLITPGVSALLRRYAECDDHAENMPLREIALRHWKSPWLDTNKALWHAHIGEEATDMVGLWLKQRSIRDFFELLQADGSADSDRMEFWLPYAEVIDEVWLALGHHSQFNSRPDYQRIRQEMEGRWMKLEGANQNADNAFLMKIGGHLVIEFARQNNACHVFDANHMPFVLGQRSVLGTQEGLKNTHHLGHRRKLMHKQGWQQDFASYLRWNLGVTPIQKSPGTSKRSSVASSTSVPHGSPHPASNSGQPVIDHELELLKKICSAHGARVIDKRETSGEVFVNGGGQNNMILAKALNAQGFSYVNDFTGWKKKWR